MTKKQFAKLIAKEMGFILFDADFRHTTKATVSKNIKLEDLI